MGGANSSQPGLAGSCRLPDSQLHCFIADVAMSSCSRELIDVITGEGALQRALLCLLVDARLARPDRWKPSVHVAMSQPCQDGALSVEMTQQVCAMAARQWRGIRHLYM